MFVIGNCQRLLMVLLSIPLYLFLRLNIICKVKQTYICRSLASKAVKYDFYCARFGDSGLPSQRDTIAKESRSAYLILTLTLISGELL